MSQVDRAGMESLLFGAVPVFKALRHLLTRAHLDRRPMLLHSPSAFPALATIQGYLFTTELLELYFAAKPMGLDMVEFAIMLIPSSRVLSQAGHMTSCVQQKVLGNEYVHCSCSLAPASVHVPLAFGILRTTTISSQTSTSCLHQV